MLCKLKNIYPIVTHALSICLKNICPSVTQKKIFFRLISKFMQMTF